jgi:hypothetical protein
VDGNFRSDAEARFTWQVIEWLNALLAKEGRAQITRAHNVVVDPARNNVSAVRGALAKFRREILNNRVSGDAAMDSGVFIDTFGTSTLYRGVQVLTALAEDSSIVTTLSFRVGPDKVTRLKEMLQAMDIPVESSQTGDGERFSFNLTDLGALNTKRLYNELLTFAGLTPGDAAMKNPGGIDLNAQQMQLTEQGQKVDMTFDPTMLEQFKSGDFTGLTPVILNITPITNIKPLLGLAPELLGNEHAQADTVSAVVRREEEV